MSPTFSSPIDDAEVDAQLVGLFRAASQAAPRDPEFVNRLMQRITARQQRRVRVLRGTVLVGLAFALGSILAWGNDWLALFALLGEQLASSPVAEGVLRWQDQKSWLPGFNLSLLTPMVAVFLWLALTEQRST